MGERQRSALMLMLGCWDAGMVRMGSLGSDSVDLGMGLLVCGWCRCQSNKTGLKLKSTSVLAAFVGQQYNLNRNKK